MTKHHEALLGSGQNQNITAAPDKYTTLPSNWSPKKETQWKSAAKEPADPERMTSPSPPRGGSR